MPFIILIVFIVLLAALVVGGILHSARNVDDALDRREPQGSDSPSPQYGVAIPPLTSVDNGGQDAPASVEKLSPEQHNAFPKGRWSLNGNDSAFPNDFRTRKADEPFCDYGLTKREYFAAVALQGLLSNPAPKDGVDLAVFAVALADSLLAKLEAPK